MAKHNFSKIFKMDPMVLKQIAIKGDPNSPYAKTLKLRVGEAFVVYNVNEKVCL
jgi:hypothetical protein